MLLVGPERMVPIGRGQERDIGRLGGRPLSGTILTVSISTLTLYP